MHAQDQSGADRADDPAARRGWMGALARARPDDLAEALSRVSDLPEPELLRGPEIGTVMVRGRAGGVGAPFNLGEMTVTRCSVCLPCGTVGHAMVRGRDRAHARRAALTDALMQTARGPDIARAVIAPLADAAETRARARAARADATRVEFFTLVRGESE